MSKCAIPRGRRSGASPSSRLQSLRTRPADQTELFTGLKYDAKRQRWGDTKIYDPQRGLRAKLTASFAADGRLALKGSLLGISETVYWTKEK